MSERPISPLRQRMLESSPAERTRNWLSHIPECEAICRQLAALASYRRRPLLRRRVRHWLRRLL